MEQRVAPLDSTFMAVSLLGFILSILFVFPESPSWGLAFSIVFFVMLVSSFLSLTLGPVELTKEYLEREKRIEEELNNPNLKVDLSVFGIEKKKVSVSNKANKAGKKTKKKRKVKKKVKKTKKNKAKKKKPKKRTTMKKKGKKKVKRVKKKKK